MESARTTQIGNTVLRKTPIRCVPVLCLTLPWSLKGLLVLAHTKTLSFREKKMLERARYLLVSELAMSKNWEEAEVEDLLNKALSKSKLRFPEASSMEA